MPDFYIIAGCNGAGKTTASFNVLPEIMNCREFVNADEIARGVSPFNPEKVAIQAGKIMLRRIDELLESRESFAIETTLTTLTYQKTIQRAKQAGYQVSLVFFWLNSSELAVERVRQRVIEGGHNIPEETIRRRYKKGIKNLLTIFSDLCDVVIMLDNSYDNYKTIAIKKHELEIIDKNTFNLLKKQANGHGKQK